MSETVDLTLHLKRVLSVPQSRIFKAYTDPDELAKWWGPKGFTAPSVHIDLRVGGDYRIGMQPPEGDLFHLAGEFLELEEPSRLAYTFRWEEPTPDDRETVVTVTLVEFGGATEVTVDQGVFATEERRALHEQGWSESLDRLQEYISPETP